MGVVEVTEECPRSRLDRKNAEPGDLLNLGSNAVIWKRRGWAKDPPTGPETATRGPTENASQRTEKPDYSGGGWWELPDGRKVRAPKDADPEDVMEEAE